MKLDIISVDTCEVLATVTTKYHNLETLLTNVSGWMRRHPQYKYVCREQLEKLGFEWSPDVYWVTEA